MPDWGAWFIKFILLVLGSWFIYKGVRLAEKDKGLLSQGTPVGDTTMGCLVFFVAGMILEGLLHLMPLRFVKMLWILLGVAFLVLGFKVPVS